MKIENFDFDNCKEPRDEVKVSRELTLDEIYKEMSRVKDRKLAYPCRKQGGGSRKSYEEAKFAKNLNREATEEGHFGFVFASPIPALPEVMKKKDDRPKGAPFKNGDLDNKMEEELKDYLVSVISISPGNLDQRYEIKSDMKTEISNTREQVFVSTSGIAHSPQVSKIESKPNGPPLLVLLPRPSSSSTLPLSSSLPSSSFLQVPQNGMTLSLPPSPLQTSNQPLQLPTSSVSLSSLHERRRSKSGLKLTPLSLHNGPSHNNQSSIDTVANNISPRHHCHYQCKPLPLIKCDIPRTLNGGDRATPTTAGTQFPVKVLPDLYLGNAQTSADMECLRRHNISYIVNATRNIANSFEDHPDFYYMRIPIIDNCWSQDMELHFQSAIDFIDEGRRKKRSVLIHCWAGINRSVTITVAYLMKSENLSMDDAYDLLKSCKSNINPDLSLMEQLELFGDKLKKERLQQQAKHFPELSNLSIRETIQQNVVKSKTMDKESNGKVCSKKPKIVMNYLASALITPETASSLDGRNGNIIFNFPCTPPATPLMHDRLGEIFENQGLSFANSKEIDDYN